MKQFRKVLWYGLIIWMIPFIISFNIYSLRSINHAFFQSLMSVVLTISVIFAADVFFSKFKKVSLYESFVIGMWWLAISLLLDFFVFILGPIRMTLFEFLSEIGSSYIIIPLITVGFNVMQLKRKEV